MFFMPMGIYSQLPDDFPAITAEDMPGAVISSPRVFTGASLFQPPRGLEEFSQAGLLMADLICLSTCPEFRRNQLSQVVFLQRGGWELSMGILTLKIVSKVFRILPRLS